MTTSRRLPTPEGTTCPGQAARSSAPRSSHGTFNPAPDRPDPVALLESQAASRVAELVPIRYGRMLVSPFTFYRVRALIMASDLSTTADSGLRSRPAVTPTLPTSESSAPRSAGSSSTSTTSMRPHRAVGVGREASRHQSEIAGAPTVTTRSSADGWFLAPREAYRISMMGFAQMTNLEVWYAHMDFEEQFEQFKRTRPAKAVKETAKAIAKAHLGLHAGTGQVH